jgi:hypothetical protein
VNIVKSMEAIVLASIISGKRKNAMPAPTAIKNAKSIAFIVTTERN